MENAFKVYLSVFSYFQDIVVINKGSRDPYLVDVLEVPKMSNKILEYVRKPKLAIAESLKTINIPNKP